MRENSDAEVWEALGNQDPDWAVATTPGRKHGGWSSDLEEFYGTGRERVSEALGMLPGLDFARALDWGSGTGRLSFALAEKFGQVTCVDISASMQELLAQRASERGITNLELVTVGAFRPAADHDLALSLITMQHFTDRHAVKEAIHAMVASLRPGGRILVEIPVRPYKLRHRLQPRLRLYRALRQVGVPSTKLHQWGLSGIKMLWAPSRWVTSELESAGATMLTVREQRGTTHQQAWYAAERTESSPAR